MIRTLLTTSAVLALLAGPALSQTSPAGSSSSVTTSAGPSGTTTSGGSTGDRTSTTAASPSGSSATTSPGASSGMATSSPAGSSATTAPSTTEAVKPAGTASLSFISEQQAGQMRADEIIGATVKNPNDETIGKIEDLILDRDSKVVGAVVSVGGFLGIGSKEVAVPWDGLQVRSSESGRSDQIVVSWTKDQLKEAPEFKSLAEKKRDADRAAARDAVPANRGTTAPATAPGVGGTTAPTR